MDVRVPAFLAADADYLKGMVVANYSSGAPITGNVTVRAAVRPVGPGTFPNFGPDPSVAQPHAMVRTVRYIVVHTVFMVRAAPMVRALPMVRVLPVVSTLPMIRIVSPRYGTYHAPMLWYVPRPHAIVCIVPPRYGT